MGVGDVSQLTFDKISEFYRKYSREKAKTSAGIRSPRSKVTKSAIRGVNR